MISRAKTTLLATWSSLPEESWLARKAKLLAVPRSPCTNAEDVIETVITRAGRFIWYSHSSSLEQHPFHPYYLLVTTSWCCYSKSPKYPSAPFSGPVSSCSVLQLRGMTQAPGSLTITLCLLTKILLQDGLYIPKRLLILDGVRICWSCRTMCPPPLPLSRQAFCAHSAPSSTRSKFLPNRTTWTISCSMISLVESPSPTVCGPSIHATLCRLHRSSVLNRRLLTSQCSNNVFKFACD